MGLTQIVVMDGSRKPMMMEVPVAPDPDLGPFLVTSTRDMVWISKAFPNGMVRTAVRDIPKKLLYRAILGKIVTRSRQEGWGSVQEPSADGVQAVIHHLADYDILDVEVLYGDGFDTGLVPDDVRALFTDWVPEGWAVIVPVDRAFVGTTFEFGESSYATLIHNASRGVGVVATEGVVLEEVRLVDLVQEGALPAAVKNLYLPRGKMPAIHTLGQLSTITRRTLLRYKGIGEKTALRIEEVLAERNLTLAGG